MHDFLNILLPRLFGVFTILLTLFYTRMYILYTVFDLPLNGEVSEYPDNNIVVPDNAVVSSEVILNDKVYVKEIDGAYTRYIEFTL